MENPKVKKIQYYLQNSKMHSMFIGDKNSMLQPSGENKLIHELTDKAIQQEDALHVYWVQELYVATT